MADINPVVSKLITGAHILHHHGVFDEVDTLSTRDPNTPQAFFVNNRPPVLLSSPDDIAVCSLPDGVPVQGIKDGPQKTDTASSIPVPSEIFLHAAIYTKYPSVMSILHSSAKEFVVFGLCDSQGSMARSVFNRAGFVDQYNPIFNTAAHRKMLPPDHPRSLMIDHPVLGAALADSLALRRRSFPNDDSSAPAELPHHRVAFIRGNGAALWAESIEEAVYKAVNLKRNAIIQTSAMLQRLESDLEITYLDLEESIDSEKVSEAAVELAWAAWAREVGSSPLYRP